MLILNSVDKEVTEKMHDGSFPFPDLNNPLYISKKTVVDSGKIVAVGLVRLTAEGILFVEPDAPLVTRARASYNVMNALQEDVKKRGLDECHIFVKDPKVQKFMEHFGFTPCKGGNALVIHF